MTKSVNPTRHLMTLDRAQKRDDAQARLKVRAEGDPIAFGAKLYSKRALERRDNKKFWVHIGLLIGAIVGISMWIISWPTLISALHP